MAGKPTELKTWLVWLAGSRGPVPQIWRDLPHVATGAHTHVDGSRGPDVVRVYEIPPERAGCAINMLVALYPPPRSAIEEAAQ